MGYQKALRLGPQVVGDASATCANIDDCGRQWNGIRGSRAPPNSEVQVTAQIPLEPELLNSLHRRGRRRLKDIQTNFQVNARIDKLRGILVITGPEASVEAAKHMISGLGGPRIPVKPAVWAELLRTRTLQSGEQAMVAMIQQESGCRIHIERSRHEVRLFGHSEAVEIAEELLEELDKNCMEIAVPMDTSGVTPAVLQAFAESCHVTLRLDDEQLVLLGIEDTVKKAAEELPRFLKDGELQSKHAASLPKEAPEVESKALVRTSFDIEKSHGMSACPTCGACAFCSSCGFPTTFAQFNGLQGKARSQHAGADGAKPLGVVCTPAEGGASEGNLQSAPWMGQQMFMMPDGSMAVDMTQGTMTQGMVPAVCMVPAFMQPGVVPASMAPGMVGQRTQYMPFSM